MVRWHDGIHGDEPGRSWLLPPLGTPLMNSSLAEDANGSSTVAVVVVAAGARGKGGGAGGSRTDVLMD